MSLLKRMLILIMCRISGNQFSQRLLQKNVFISQYLMGIGSGSGVLTSGERMIFKILSEKCDPPYCIFDVGANKGQYLDLALEALYTDDYLIHCFEPGVESFKVLTERKKDSRIILNNIGIGKEKGCKTLYYDAPGSGLASLSKRNLDSFGIEFNKSETVQIDTIDNYCTEKKIDRISLLKIDIEGHEMDALAGAKEKFFNHAIDIVTFEFGGCNIDTRTFFRDFWVFFQRQNMKLYRITLSGYLSQINSYKEIDEQFRTTNFIALN